MKVQRFLVTSPAFGFFVQTVWIGLGRVSFGALASNFHFLATFRN